MQVVRIGVVGAGFVAHFQPRALMQVRNVTIDGITSRTTRSAEALSKMVRANGANPLCRRAWRSTCILVLGSHQARGWRTE